MKKYTAFLSVLALLAFGWFYTGSASAGALEGFKEFVTEDDRQVPEINSLWDVLGVAQIDQSFVSSQKNDKYDYAVQMFNACKLDQAAGKCLEEPYVLVAFYSVTAVKDAEGKEKYDGELIALVFTGPKIVWFKSEKAKQAFKAVVLEGSDS